MKHPDERKIKRYQKEDPKFDPNAYRKAWYRTGRLIEARRKGNDQAKGNRSR
jgi:hypothetical protein